MESLETSGEYSRRLSARHGADDMQRFTTGGDILGQRGVGGNMRQVFPFREKANEWPAAEGSMLADRSPQRRVSRLELLDRSPQLRQHIENIPALTKAEDGSLAPG